jgi:hypothetical protein
MVPDFTKEYYSFNHLKEIFLNHIINKGGAGIDGITTKKFEKICESEIQICVKKIDSYNYAITRYKSKLVSKGPGKFPRVISIPTIRDKIVLRAACEALQDTFRDAITKKPHVYIKIIKDFINRKKLENKEIFFLRLDIKDFYPSIDQSLLFTELSNTKIDKKTEKIVRCAILAKTVGADVTGIPQGLSISNILAGIYMMPFDNYALKNINNKDVLSVRYVDDILVLTTELEIAENIYYEVSKFLLENRKLKCHDLSATGKTSICKIMEGIDYLGYRFDSNGVSVRENSYKKMFKTIFEVICSYKRHSNLPRLVFELNLKITGCFVDGKNYGWMLFFLQTDNVKQLARLDKFVEKVLTEKEIEINKKLIKKFVKSYNYLRFKGNANYYVPDFSLYNINDMIDFLNIFGEKIDKNNYNKDEVESNFWRKIKSEVKNLESDVMEFFS